eukprot:8861527-Alexandrium_andersonii.AAC.1
MQTQLGGHSTCVLAWPFACLASPLTHHPTTSAQRRAAELFTDFCDAVTAGRAHHTCCKVACPDAPTSGACP